MALVLWLWFGRNLPSSDEATGLLADIYDLAELLGPAPLLAATSFAAFLIGVVLSSGAPMERIAPAFEAVAHKLPWGRPIRERVHGANFRDDRKLRQIDANTARELTAMASNLFREQAIKAGSFPPDPQNEELNRNILGEGIEMILDELPQLTMKLQINSNAPQLFQSYDRKKSEAEFRQAIALPTAALIVTICVLQGVYLLLLALIGPLALAIQGVRKAREARSEVIQAMLAGVIESAVQSRAKSTLETEQGDR